MSFPPQAPLWQNIVNCSNEQQVCFTKFSITSFIGLSQVIKKYRDKFFFEVAS